MRLKEWMRENGATLSQLADQLAIAAVSVGRYVEGSRLPKPDIAARIVKITRGQVTVQDLYDTRLAFLRNKDAV